MEGDREKVEEMQGYAHIMNLSLAFVGPMVLKCTVQLGLADIIHSHARALTLSELAAALPYDSVREDLLYRILRYLVHMGVFTVETNGDGQQRYGLTPASKFIRKDWKKSIFPAILWITHEGASSSFHCLSAALDAKKMATPYEMKHGKKVWESVCGDPELNHIFHEAMAAETRTVMSAIVRDGGAAFQGIGSLVDVGGGTGMATAFLVEAFPHIKCTVLDIPAVAAGRPRSKNVTLISGDMFSFIPLADVVLLKNVLHDWGDEDCIKILKQCKKAIPNKGGKVIIVEIILEEGEEDVLTNLRLSWDMCMALIGGKERTKEEWKTLLQTSGFDISNIIHTGSSQSIIEAYPN